MIHEKKIWEYTLQIYYDEFPDNPLDNWLIKMDVRKHRNYSFPNDFNFNWEEYDEWNRSEINRISKEYNVIFLDCYIHSGISFSFMGEWMQCRFDTAKCVGFIAVKKKDFRKPKHISYLREKLTQYNQYLNWDVYAFQLFRNDEILGTYHGAYSYKEVEYILDPNISEHKELFDWVKTL